VSDDRAQQPRLASCSASSGRTTTRGGHAPEQLGQADTRREPLDHPRRDLRERQRGPYRAAALDHLWTSRRIASITLSATFSIVVEPTSRLDETPIEHSLVHAIAETKPGQMTEKPTARHVLGSQRVGRGDQAALVAT